MKVIRKTATLVLSLAVAGTMSVAFAGNASANHNPPLQPSRTIVYQYMTGKVPAAWQTIFNDRLHYLGTIPGQPIKVVQGSCQLYLTCVRIYAEAYGNLGWLGLTTYSNQCGTYLCKYTAAPGTWTTIQINTTLADSLPAAQKTSLACHEEGHSVKLSHSGGVTCMQANSNDGSLGNVSHFLNTGSTADTNEELELYQYEASVPVYGTPETAEA